MISFRLLGAVELHDAAGRVVNDLLRRPRRIAFLSYLAAAHPHGYHRRDKLLALFWADATPDQARKALDQSLFDLREALGRDVIRSRGADEISLNGELFVVDERCFDESVKTNDYERALDCYRGEFLDGFYLSGAPDFEHWADRERTRLREEAIRVAFTLAAKYERENNKLAAFERARWAATMAPADEEAFRNLVRLLDRSGEQAAALREYDEFARRLADSYGCAPSRETQALLDEIRSRRTALPIVMPAARTERDEDRRTLMRPRSLPDRLDRALAGRYKILRPLGTGGMSAVFLADDLRNRRKVAIKVLRPEVAKAIGADRFLREVRIEAHLEHPHIVPLYDSGDADGLPYYVMRYYESESLKQRLQREPQLPIEETIRITKDVAAALDFAHDSGVVHRDVKPENILLGDGGAVVTDFGIARALTQAGAVRLTVTGMAIGTPGYMSPEQATGESGVDQRSDQYSLACIVYEMLAGEMLFTGSTARAIIAKHVSAPPTPLRVLRPSVPLGMERAVLRALHKSATDRFASVGAFVAALEVPSTARSRRGLPGLVTGALAAVLVVAVAVTLWDRLGRASDVATTPTLNPATVAVLGLESAAGDPELTAFADNLTSRLIDALSSIETLDVPSRRAVEAYANRELTVDSVARALGAGILIGGYVESLGELVRITLRFIDGRTGKQIRISEASAEFPERHYLVDAVADTVIALLQQELGQIVRRQNRFLQTSNVAAFQHVQWADERYREFHAAFAAGDFRLAAQILNEADSLLAEAEPLDPNWIEPVVKRAELPLLRVMLASATGDTNTLEYLRHGLDQANRAFTMDPADVRSRYVRGKLRYWIWSRHPPLHPDSARQLVQAAEDDLRSASSGNPDRVEVFRTLSDLMAETNRLDQAISYGELAYESDRFLEHTGEICFRLFEYNFQLSRDQAARDWCLEGARRFPEDPKLTHCRLRLMAWSDVVPPDPARARALRARTLQQYPASIRHQLEPVLVLEMAAVLARAGRSSRATRIVDSVIAHSPLTPILVVKGAGVLATLGDTARSRALLAAFLEDEPTGAEDLWRRRELSRLR